MGTGCIISCLRFCHANNPAILQSASLKVASSPDGFFVVIMKITQAQRLALWCEDSDFYSATLLMTQVPSNHFILT